MNTDLKAVAAALRGVPGVAAASVDPDASGGIDCLRIRLAADADARGMAQAASQLVHERFGTRLHRDQVVIVKDALPEAAAVPAQREVGPRSCAPTSSRRAGTSTPPSCCRRCRGRGRATRVARRHPRGCSERSHRRVEGRRATGGTTARLELDYVDVSQSGQDRTVVVALTLISDRGVERLAGAAVVRGDENGAVVRASLDAVNRSSGAVPSSGLVLWPTVIDACAWHDGLVLVASAVSSDARRRVAGHGAAALVAGLLIGERRRLGGDEFGVLAAETGPEGAASSPTGWALS